MLCLCHFVCDGPYYWNDATNPQKLKSFRGFRWYQPYPLYFSENCRLTDFWRGRALVPQGTPSGEKTSNLPRCRLFGHRGPRTNPVRPETNQPRKPLASPAKTDIPWRLIKIAFSPEKPRDPRLQPRGPPRHPPVTRATQTVGRGTVTRATQTATFGPAVTIGRSTQTKTGSRVVSDLTTRGTQATPEDIIAASPTSPEAPTTPRALPRTPGKHIPRSVLERKREVFWELFGSDNDN